MQQGEQVLSKLKNLESGEIRIGASDMTLQFTCFRIWICFTRNTRRSKYMSRTARPPRH